MVIQFNKYVKTKKKFFFPKVVLNIAIGWLELWNLNIKILFSDWNVIHPQKSLSLLTD